jgi:hypothetical protein
MKFLTLSVIAVLGIASAWLAAPSLHAATESQSSAVTLLLTEAETGSPSVEVTNGQRITMAITATGAQQMAGTQFDIVFDEVVLTVDDVRMSASSAGTLSDSNAAGAGLVRMIFVGTTASGLETVPVGEIEFTVIGKPGASSSISFANVVIADESLRALPHVAEPATITIAGQPGATPDPATDHADSAPTLPVIGDAPAIAAHLNHADIASGALTIDETIAYGAMLFSASFNTLDGAGRPTSTGTGGTREPRVFPENFNRISGPDSNACSGCHNLPGSGGGGDNVANVFVLAQALPFADDMTLSEIGNERNTLGMFGSGFIELLAREMTADLLSIRFNALLDAHATNATVKRPLLTKGVEFGSITAFPDGRLDTSDVEGVDEDLVIKPFHQKGAVVSLREFTVNAANHHHGMQAAERFGEGQDPDGDGVVDELTPGDITGLTLFQALLPPPVEMFPVGKLASDAATLGRELFQTTGCSQCHMQSLPLDSTVFAEPGPYNPPGTLGIQDNIAPVTVDLLARGLGAGFERGTDGSLLIPVFTDLKRHDMGALLDNESLVQAGVPTNEWMTRKLWGFASEPPFLHHGKATLISEAILAHGGEALDSRTAFDALGADDQAAVVEFLKTLVIQPGEQPAPQLSGRLADDVVETTSAGWLNTKSFLLGLGVALLLLVAGAIGAGRMRRSPS